MIYSIISATAAEVFTYIGYIIAALLALMVMIVLHELGHYTAGKILGFKIDEFSIGFGPKIVKIKNKKNGELFSIRPFLLGGFCAFHGEDMDGYEVDENGNPKLDENGNKIVDKDAFNSQKAWKRLIVLFSGAFMNFLSAIVIITIYFSAYGQILPYVVDAKSTISYENQFQAGDVILNIDGSQVNIMLQEDLDRVFTDIGDEATFYVLRDGKRIKINATKFFYQAFEDTYVYSVNGNKLETPIKYEDLNTMYSDSELTLVCVTYDTEGNIITQSSGKVFKGLNPNDTTNYYSYGFGLTRSLTRAKLPFGLAFGRSFGFCFFIVFKILASLGALITGQVGAESAGGTITTIKVMADTVSYGFDSFLYVVAIISANLAVMNLLPFPALDGSRMLFTLIEIIFRKPVPRKIEAVIHTVGLILLVLLAVFLDVFHLVKG